MTVASAQLRWPDGKPFDGFVWDHWRIGADASGLPLFCALIDYGAGWRHRLGQQTHHFASSWALLRRLSPTPQEVFEIVQPDLLCGNPQGPDDASVWSGCGISTSLMADPAAPERVFALFFTARHLQVPRVVLGEGAELDQEVRLAVLRPEASPGLGPVWRLHRTQLVLRPDPSVHVTSAVAGPSVVPAFRDPFVFRDAAGGVHLVVSTRLRDGPEDNDASLSFYAIEGPLDDPRSYRPEGHYAPECFLEMECAHVGRAADGRRVLTFSTGGREQAPEGTRRPVRDLVAVDLDLDAEGRLRFVDGRLQAGAPETILPAERGLYAGWVDGDVVRGFAWQGGGLCHTGFDGPSLDEQTDFAADTRVVSELGPPTELSDRTHQWDLRRAALFTRSLDAGQRVRVTAGEPLLKVLTPAQRRLLDDFYASRI